MYRQTFRKGNSLPAAILVPDCRPALCTAIALAAATVALWGVASTPGSYFLPFGLALSLLLGLLVQTVLAVRVHAGTAAAAGEKVKQEASLRVRAEGLFEEAHKELESRVAERTAELNSANRALHARLDEREWAEQELTRLAAVVEQMSEGVLVFDKYKKICYINPALERMSGFQRSELIGGTTDMLGIHQSTERLYDSIWTSVEREGVWRGRVNVSQKSGATFEADAVVSPIRDASGQVINYVGVGRDVTHEVQLEGQLWQAQKTEALGTLAGGIAHDFNNILGAIIAFTELAQDGLSNDDPARQDLDEVLKAGLRGKSLIKQILTFSRPGEQERRPVELGLVVKEALRLLRASLPTTIEIRHDLGRAPAGLDVIVADPTEMHQVLVNLCSNSFHAMREGGGVLDVIAECVDIAGDTSADHPELGPGPYLRLTVSDNGHGMTREVLERIFDPYFTTKKSGEGTGLGLSVVQGIVRSHGGTITVYSAPEEGTSFHIYLPRVSAGAAEEDDSSEPLPTGNEKILFIDDEEALVLAGQRILEHLGYEVVTSTSGLEALGMFQAEPDRFDLVISDQTMPQTTGLDLAAKLLKMRPDLPIILYTGFSGATTEEKAKELGIREFILKPMTTRRMAEAVRNVLDGVPCEYGEKDSPQF